MTDGDEPSRDPHEGEQEVEELKPEEQADTNLDVSHDAPSDEAAESQASQNEVPQAPENIGEDTGEAATGEFPTEVSWGEPEQEVQEDAEQTEGTGQQADLEAEDGFLEEAFYPSTLSEKTLEQGAEYTWGGVTFTIEAALPRSWYRAREETGEPILVRAQPRQEVWNRLPKHPLLPRVLYNGPEGFAVAYAEGDVVETPVGLEHALTYTLALAQLVRFFEVQGQAVLYLDPDGLLLTEAGLCLRYPPHLTPLGDPLPNFYREGYTAPEVQAGAAATGKEGVYALAALSLQLLTGRAPPPEGPSLLMLKDVKVPGLPQLLFAALGGVSGRTEPEAFVRAVKALKEQHGAERPVFQIGAATSVGLNADRPVNEDGYGYVYDVLESYGGLSRMLRACVADGMGGEAAGERASRAAVETFCRDTPSRPLDTAQAQAEWTLHLAWRANEAVLEVLSGQDGGCTLTGVVVIGNRLSLAHVGDTRAYLASGQGLAPLTKDHSLVNALLANGMITAEEAQTSPDRNKILRSLGSVRRVQAGYIDGLEPVRHAQTVALAAGDAIILVSDGVWGEVDDARIRTLAEDHTDDPQALAEALVDEALQAGAPDNATALVVRRSR